MTLLQDPAHDRTGGLGSCTFPMNAGGFSQALWPTTSTRPEACPDVDASWSHTIPERMRAQPWRTFSPPAPAQTYGNDKEPQCLADTLAPRHAFRC